MPSFFSRHCAMWNSLHIPLIGTPDSLFRIHRGDLVVMLLPPSTGSKGLSFWREVVKWNLLPAGTFLKCFVGFFGMSTIWRWAFSLSSRHTNFQLLFLLSCRWRWMCHVSINKLSVRWVTVLWLFLKAIPRLAWSCFHPPLLLWISLGVFFGLR